MIEALAAWLMLSLLSDQQPAQNRSAALFNELASPDRILYFAVLELDQSEIEAGSGVLAPDRVQKWLKGVLFDVGAEAEACKPSGGPVFLEMLRAPIREEGPAGPILWVGLTISMRLTPAMRGMSRERLLDHFEDSVGWVFGSEDVWAPGFLSLVDMWVPGTPVVPILTKEERREIEAKKLLGAWPAPGTMPRATFPEVDTHRLVWKDYWDRIVRASNWSPS